MSSAHEPARASRGVLWVVCGLLATALAWSCIGELDVVSTVRGRIVSEARMKVVQSTIPGTVRAIHVREGETVHADQLLIELDPRLLQADVASAREKLSSVEAELARLEAEQHGGNLLDDERNAWAPPQVDALRARRAGFEQKKAEYRAVLESRKVALAGGNVLVKSLQRRLAIAVEKERRARPYVDVAMPRFQFLQLQDDVASIEQQLAAQRLSNQRLAREIEEASQRLLQISSQWQQDLSADIIAQQSALRLASIDLAKAEKRLEEVMVRAPEGGIVQKVIPTTLGASLGAHEPLVHIVPADSRLQLEVLIPNEEMGYIRPNRPVDIKFDAFPFQKYGRMAGTLSWISPDAELTAPANISLLTSAATLRAVQRDAPRYYYRGIVSLDPTSNPLLQVVPGMTVQAEIHTDRRRVIDFFLFPTRQWLEEGVRVR